MLGSDIVLRAARMWNKPLISRCGYMFSDHVARQYGDGSSRARKARKLEQHVFKSADRIIVTTDQMLKDIELRLPSCCGKIDVVPNYVDTERFFPIKTKKDCDILFIGRLANQKNPTALLEAAKKVKAQIVVIGNGPLEKELKENYGNMNGRLEWKGNIPNSELPGYMNISKLFVLPSHYEGHPKTLIEAMSCGMPVIGADSPGIREVIRHGENGWLCGTDADSISQAIQHLLENPDLAQRLGDNARQFVLQNYALEDIVEKELKVIKKVAMVEN
jgi:glycosyltransferase involved in cell wall biosynthesis